MFLRLAFAVAAHLEPDILIVERSWPSAMQSSNAGASVECHKPSAKADRDRGCLSELRTQRILGIAIAF